MALGKRTEEVTDGLGYEVERVGTGVYVRLMITTTQTRLKNIRKRIGKNKLRYVIDYGKDELGFTELTTDGNIKN